MLRRLIYLASVFLVLAITDNTIAQPTGEILIEWWLDVGGNATTDVTSNPDFPDNPAGSAKLNTFELPRTKSGDLTVLVDNYAARLRGYLYPPATGDYTFWITGDNGSDFLMSTDDDPANTTLICQVPGTGYTGNREWDKYPEQKSNPVTLQAGVKYYVEVLFKEGGGGDGVAVAWGGPTIGAGPVVIDGQYLSSLIRPVDFLADEPVPADDGVVPATWVSLSWTPGYKAVSHDVYMGDNFDDVNDGTGDTFQGNQTTVDFIVGFQGFPFPEGLVIGTTYYWRIDEVDADGTTHKGTVWSFLVPSLKAYNPDPLNDEYLVETDVRLSWEAGFGAKLHYFYFGDDFDTIANATGGSPVGNTTFDPGPLEFNKTYYWRVDEFDPPNTYTGDVWSFTTTIPTLGTAVMDRWEGLSGSNINTLKNSPDYPENPDVTETVTSFLWDANDIDNYGARIEAWLHVPVTGDYTFWLATDDQGELWLSTDEDPVNGVLIANVPGYSSVNQWTKYDSQKSDPIHLIGGEKYYIMAIWKESSGGDHCNVAWEGPGLPSRATIPGSYLSPYEPVNALGPKPSNFAVDVTQTPILQWKPGLKAASHEVYFGTDPNAVAGATKVSPEYAGTRQLGDEYFETSELGWDTTYYWRIDEVNTTNPDSPWVGKVWSFTTADYGIVDDFESYNDIPAGEPGSNLVYLTWIDGFDNPNVNGSTMGYITGASMETGNVHGDLQSVAFQFDNTTAGVSEVVRTFTPARDWAANGAITLSLWFTGSGTNVPGQLYVKINNAQVNYTGDMNNLKRNPWQVWNIDLTTVNTNLSNVTSLAIGIQGPGAKGTLLLDDIRLYTQAGEQITPVQPDPAGLVAQFAFDGNADDSVGGHNGIVNGNPLYPLGKFGQAIALDGIDDYVVIGSVGISGTDPRTIAGWAKANILGTPAWVNVFGFTGPSGNNGHFDIELVGDTTTTTLGWYGLHVYGWEQNIMPIDLEWHHLGASYDGTTIKWYGDGLLVGSEDRTLSTPDNVHVGKRDDNTNYFPGQVDDFRIYNRILSDEEMAGLAGITKPYDKPF